MAQIHLLLDPAVEPVAQHGGYDVADPLLRRLRELNLSLRQVDEDVGMIVVQESEYFFDAEAFILRNVDGLHHLGRDHLLPAGH